MVRLLSWRFDRQVPSTSFDAPPLFLPVSLVNGVTAELILARGNFTVPGLTKELSLLAVPAERPWCLGGRKEVAWIDLGRGVTPTEASR